MSNENWAMLWQFVTYGGAVLAATGVLGGYIIGEKIKVEQEKINATTGVITPPDTLNTKKLEVLKEESFLIKFGTNKWRYKTIIPESNSVQFNLFGDTNQGLSLFGFKNFRPVIFTYKDKKVFVTAQIYDREGKIVCEIENNEWSTNSNNFYKRNYDSQAVEVIDQYNNVVLSVELQSENIIDLKGIFFSDRGDCISINDESIFVLRYIGKLPSTVLPEISLSRYNEEGRRITRKFVYVGKDYLGKRIDSKK